MRWLLASVVVSLVASLAGAAPAWARSQKTLAYPRDQAWPAAVRFLAVDERLAIVEGGRAVVRFVLAIEDRPSWLEVAMLGRLERKLRLELGSPAPAPSPAPKPSPPPKDPPKDAPRAPAPPEGDGGPPISPTP